ncbi:glycosyltransferase family 2 protein [Olsenella uli]|nr:glycosyltransferase family 2 protein [Olsenella uli]
MPVISVIVPVYNVERFLGRCLDSLIVQNYQDFEIILIDDRGTDGSSAIAQNYATRYPHLIRYIINSENLGLGATRDRGIAEARGEYLMFVDSDDYVAPDYLNTYLTAMLEQPVDVVVGGYTRDVDGKLTPHPAADNVWSLTTYTIACAKLFRTAFLREHDLHFSRSRCGEDIYFSSSLFCCSPSFCVIPYAGYHYFFNRSSITGSLDHTKDHEVFVARLFDELLADHPLEQLTVEQKWVVQYTYLANMLNALLVHNRGCGIRRMREKRAFVFDDALHRFPDIDRNPLIALRASRGQTPKIRLSVWLLMRLRRIHCDGVVYTLAALI